MKKIFIALLFISLLLAGCSAAKATQAPAPGGYEVPSMPEAAPVTANDGQRQSLGSGVSGEKSAYAPDQPAASVDRLVIKNANLSIAVDDPLKSMDAISKMAEGMGGFVVKADMYQQPINNGTKVPYVTMTVRVPADRLDEAMATIKAQTNQPILSENENSQDVTAEYTDLNSKLINLEAAEKQLQEIMGSATKTEDVLAVYAQLVSVREQIEVIKGQMKYYEQSAALSSINVQLTANAAMQPITIAGWQPKGVAKEALQSLIYTLQELGSFGIRLVILYIPTLILIFGPLALVIWGIIALVKKARRGKRTPRLSPEA